MELCRLKNEEIEVEEKYSSPQLLLNFVDYEVVENSAVTHCGTLSIVSLPINRLVDGLNHQMNFATRQLANHLVPTLRLAK